MRLKELLSHGKRALFHLLSPELDSRLLLQYICHKSFEELIKDQNQEASKDIEEIFFTLLERRKNLEPIGYITGYKSFYDLEFEVSKDTLIPRSDSETLIDWVLKEHYQKDLKILDLGTGSGCLIITLLKHLPSSMGVAVDISSKALNIAKRNADKIGVQNRLIFLQSNWFNNIPPQTFDIIVSNPPYIGLEENISPEVKYEPQNALFAGRDGLDAYKRIVAKAKGYLSHQGALYLEIGYKQKELVQEIFANHAFKLDGTRKDLQNHIRCLKFRLSI